jgi:inositol phosphorylceramide mannosyltransferase catalytic subunit
VVSRADHWNEVLPRFAEKASISHEIHQIFLNGDLPEPLSSNVARLSAQNHEYSHTLYDLSKGEAFINGFYGRAVLELFRRISPAYGAARADLLRYLIVYAVGGAYIDIKSYMDRPLREVLQPSDSFVLSYWDNSPGGEYVGFGKHAELGSAFGEFQQWHVIAAAGHPFLRAVVCSVLANIENYRPWRQGVGRNGVLRTTGPIAYSKAIMPLLDKNEHRLLRKPAEIGLHYSIANTYDHRAIFPHHYSTLTAPVASVPLWARLPTAMFSYAARLRG